MKHLHAGIIGITLGFLLFFSSCCKDDDKPKKPCGKIAFEFSHLVDGKPILFDTMAYVNAAGNHYMVNEIQYFISDVVLFAKDGSQVKINAWKDIHYVDTDIPTTLGWNVFDDIPEGSYDSIGFTFGLDEAKNKNGLFVNPPEVNMFWPDMLGGGFHYLKLDGKWLSWNIILPFNFHLGIGRVITPTDTTFEHNFFKVKLPNSSFSVSRDSTTHIGIAMNVDSWFTTPHVWNHDSIGGAIMENEDAMRLAKENGWDVFSMKLVK